jgi:hypothetical protein
MSGFGSSPWGSGPWGGGAPSETAAESERFTLSEVNVWAADLLELVFSAPAKNNDVLRLAASYSVLAVDSGIPVRVRAVRPGTAITISRVFLVITPATLGACYDVSVIGDLRSAYDNGLTSPVTQRIRIHRTKVDSMLSTRPNMYDLRVEAVYRNLLNAIGYQDHLIGGTILNCDED